MDGILNVYKEKGWTSFDVVAKLRGILKMKKIGHAGTLDPNAEGVLIVALGGGTKAISYLEDRTKTYEAVLKLGVCTDTEDIWGKVISENEVNVTQAEIMEAVRKFEGEIEQVPPMYSALHHDGKRLYELAREGKVVERKARKITVEAIHVNEIHLGDDENTVTMTVRCSKGTYIRTLCKDIGEALGCGGCMAALTRTRVGSFTLDESLNLSQIEAAVSAGEIEDRVVAMDQLFNAYPDVTVSEELERLALNGNKIPLAAVTGEELTGGSYVRISTKDKFCGIYQVKEGSLVPDKMFMTVRKR